MNVSKAFAALTLAFLFALPPAVAAPPHALGATITCASEPGGRTHCPANTGAGVTLIKSYGSAPCLLGKSWGSDEQGIWVSDGCIGEFVTADAGAVTEQKEKAEPGEPKKSSPEYIPNIGFRLYEGTKGSIYLRLFTYVRYLNQRGLDSSYTDFFGNVHDVKQRQDIQLNKFFFPFSGWFLNPRFRYFLYVWTSNASQGDPAQVVAGGYLSYIVNRFATVGAGIASLPTVRSTEGQFPYWLGVDNRLIADEFFRGSYTTGVWVKGEFATKFKYMAMVGNNLSQLGVSAAQLDNGLNTQSLMLAWLPTTSEFGLYGTFGDLDYHEKAATRLAAHFTHSREDKQTQPGTNSIENSQIRLTDGSNIFTPDLFGTGTSIDRVTYKMASIDGGVKYKGFSVEAEYYMRWLSNFSGANTAGIAGIDDHGYQIQTSAVAVPKILQFYLSGSQIKGHYGDGSELRAGVNWYVLKDRGLRLNAEWIHLNKCPVGYTAVPYPVGGNGDVYHMDLEMNF